MPYYFPNTNLDISTICGTYGVAINMGALNGKKHYDIFGASYTVSSTNIDILWVATGYNGFGSEPVVTSNDGLTWAASNNQPFTGKGSSVLGVGWNSMPC